MSIEIQNVIIPLSNFYIATNITTSVLLDTDGSPVGSWHHVGATIGEGVYEYSREIVSLDLEGETSRITGGTFYGSENLRVTVPVAEVTHTNMLYALPNASGTVITLGGDTRTFERSVLLVAEHRAGAGTFHYFLIYRAIVEDTVSFSFSKSDATVVEITFSGVLDISRARGDRLGRVELTSV